MSEGQILGQALTVLGQARTVLLIDWPSRDVPEGLVRAGFVVYVKGGPGPNDYARYEDREGEVVARPTGGRPDGVDLVYAHRPLEEMPGIVTLAEELGARAVWRQSGVDESGNKDPRGCWTPQEESGGARALVEKANMVYVERPYIGEALRDYV